MIVSISSSPMDNRTLLIIDDATQRGVVVDPSFDIAPVESAIAERGVKLEAIVLTHGHIDHIVGVPHFTDTLGLPVWIHRDDAPLLGDPVVNGSLIFGIQWKPIEHDRLLNEGDNLTIGNTGIRVLHTPGHTRGGITLDINSGEALITGDLLFRGGVGRTDLPGGDHTTLMNSIGRLLSEFDNPPIHPGHGPASTLAQEREHNPFLVD